MAGIQQAASKGIGAQGTVIRKSGGFDWEGAMAASLAGDAAAYRRLLEEAGRWLRRYFARRLSPEMIDDAVQEALTEVKGYLSAGDHERAKLWLNRRKHLSALMPAIVAQVVEDAIGCVKEQRARLFSVAKENGEQAAKDLAPNLSLDPIDAAINWTIASEQPAGTEAH